MKLLLTGPPIKTLGGIQNYLVILINYLKKKNHEVEYFTQPMKSSKNIFFIFLFFIQYFKFIIAIKDKRPDIIHLNFSLIFASVVRDFIFLNILHFFKCPTILFIHGWRWTFFNEIKKSSLFSNIFKNNMNKSDKILVLSKEFKNVLVGIGVDKDKIFVTTTMVESDKYIASKKIFKEPFQILFCANMKKEKGPYIVLESIPLILDKFPNTKFVFLGSGRELNKLRSKAKLMRLESNVYFPGYVSLKEKQIIFKKSHLFVFPTEHAEGFPTVIPEAMASGMPIITPAIAGLKDVLEDGKQGFIIQSKPPNAFELSTLVNKILVDKELINKISKNNIREAKLKYDVNVVCNNIEKIYLEFY